MKTWSERCFEEATENVIFLLQWRRWHCTKEPYDAELDEDNGVWIRDGVPLSWEELADEECAFHTWETEGVSLTREEGRRFFERQEYNYPDGWRVYGVCCRDRELVEAVMFYDSYLQAKERI